jgi:hypothetical protein
MHQARWCTFNQQVLVLAQANAAQLQQNGKRGRVEIL